MVPSDFLMGQVGDCHLWTLLVQAMYMWLKPGQWELSPVAFYTKANGEMFSMLRELLKPEGCDSRVAKVHTLLSEKKFVCDRHKLLQQTKSSREKRKALMEFGYLNPGIPEISSPCTVHCLVIWTNKSPFLLKLDLYQSNWIDINSITSNKGPLTNTDISGHGRGGAFRGLLWHR